MAFEYPFAEPGLVLVQRQVPVGGLLPDRFGSAEFGLGVEQFLGAEGAAALFALVPVGVRIAAFRAGPDYIAVGQEGLRLRVVGLLALPGDETSFVVELAEEVRCILLVDLGGGPGVDVEIDSEPQEGILYDSVVLVDYVLWRDPVGAGLDGYRDSVLIGTADEKQEN